MFSMKPTLTLLGLVVCLTLTGASVSARQSTPRESLVVSTSWLADHLKDPNLVLLHLGVKGDYDAAHIPGARFINLNEIALSDTSETGLALQMPEPADLKTRIESIG